MNKNVTLIIGGARSGKSHFAESLPKPGQNVTYVATAPMFEADPEWKVRMAAHKNRRPAHWQTIETVNLDKVLAESTSEEFLIIDCLTLWCSATIDGLNGWERIENNNEFAELECELSYCFQNLTKSLAATFSQVVIVTNEVGYGIVPELATTRFFRDQLGKLNIAVAAISGTVFQVTAGIPVKLK
jgi:adenosylcobinamide kinase/adenosylcobinamide-phosphate guanylyltransferase